MGAALVLLLVGLGAMAAGVLIGRYYVPDDRQLRRTARHSKAYMRALSHLIARDHETVVNELRAVVEENVDDVEPYFALGAVFRSRGEHERAIRVHQALALRERERRKLRQRAMYELGLDFRAAGMPRRATRAMEEVVLEEPDHEGALRVLAALYEEQARFNEAAELWQRLGRRRGEDTSHREHHLLVAAAQAALGRDDLDSARQLLKSAQKIEESAHFYAAAAELAAARNNHQGAKERLKQALIADPALAPHLLPGLIAAEQGLAGPDTGAARTLSRADDLDDDAQLDEAPARRLAAATAPQLRAASPLALPASRPDTGAALNVEPEASASGGAGAGASTRRTDSELASASDRPAIVGGQQAASGHRPAVVGEQQAASGQRQAADGDRPSVVGGQQAAIGQRQSADGDRSAVSGDRPAASGDRPAVVGGQQAVIGQRQAADGDRAAAGGDRPSVVGGQQAAIGHRQSADGGPPSAGGYQRLADGARPAASGAEAAGLSVVVAEGVRGVLDEVEAQRGPRLEIALIRAQLGAEDAAGRAALARELGARFPEALAARVAAARLAIDEGDPRGIRGALEGLVAEGGALAWALRGRWQCGHCGHRPGPFSWRCGQCRRWDTLRMETGIEPAPTAPRERRTAPRSVRPDGLLGARPDEALPAATLDAGLSDSELARGGSRRSLLGRVGGWVSGILRRDA